MADEQDFANDLEDLIDVALQHGVSRDDIISTLELKLMALKEEQGA